MAKGKRRKFDKPDPARKAARKRKNVMRSMGLLGKPNKSGHRGRIARRIGAAAGADLSAEKNRMLKEWERNKKSA